LSNPTAENDVAFRYKEESLLIGSRANQEYRVHEMYLRQRQSRS